MDNEKLLEKFKHELLKEIRGLLHSQTSITTILNSRQVKEIFDISETKLYELRKQGKIPFLKIDGKYLYELDALLKSFREEGSGSGT